MGEIEMSDEERSGKVESRHLKKHEDLEEMKEVFKTLREEVPGLIKEIIGPLRELIDSFYSEEAGRRRGKAVGAMYQELVKAGIPEREALEIAKSQLIDMRGLLTNIFSSKTGKRVKERITGKIGEEIEEEG